MQIKHLSIKNFRGISSLDWTLNGSTICLIGPNDSRKSTILDAIEYVLSPRGFIPFSDTDFFHADTSKPIIITVTVGELPDKSLFLHKFGGHLRGWKNGELIDEPSDEYEEVLTICLKVDHSLEPEWHVINERRPDGEYISQKDRELLGVSRLNSYVDRDLTWSRGSALSRVTGEVDTLPATLAQINRSAKQAFSKATLTELEETVKRVNAIASSFGVKAEIELRPAIDAQVGLGVGGLAMHDGEIPSRQMGLGSRRLLTAAIQKSTTKDGAILLVDEIEHGLEPHRLRQFVRLIRAGNKDGDMPYVAQTILITHSTTAICELKSSELCVVRVSNGIVTITAVTDDLQSLVRSMPDAFLAKRVIVCEGRTEFGIFRSLNDFWASHDDDKGFAYYGTIPVDGGGSTAPERAILLAKLGYAVLLFVDSDVPIKEKKRQDLADAKVELIEWDENTRTEARLCRDLPWDGLQELLDLAIASKDENSILIKIAEEIGCTRSDLKTPDINDWLKLESRTLSQEEIRSSIENAEKKAATELINSVDGSILKKKNPWFKDINQGEELGQIIAKYMDAIPDTDLYKKLNEVHEWVITP